MSCPRKLYNWPDETEIRPYESGWKLNHSIGQAAPIIQAYLGQKFTKEQLEAAEAAETKQKPGAMEEENIETEVEPTIMAIVIQPTKKPDNWTEYISKILQLGV